MAHRTQQIFLLRQMLTRPRSFINVTAIDVGSRDINGNNRWLFMGGWYLGIDLSEGPNVDVIGRAHEVLPDLPECDTIISTEALEHDSTYHLTLPAMYARLKPGGLMVVTCAGEGRQEHGTHEADSWCSPDTLDYYQNVTSEMFARALPPGGFSRYYLRQYKTDLQFYGIKRL